MYEAKVNPAARNAEQETNSAPKARITSAPSQSLARAIDQVSQSTPVILCDSTGAGIRFPAGASKLAHNLGRAPGFVHVLKSGGSSVTVTGFDADNINVASDYDGDAASFMVVMQPGVHASLGTVPCYGQQPVLPGTPTIAYSPPSPTIAPKAPSTPPKRAKGKGR